MLKNVQRHYGCERLVAYRHGEDRRDKIRPTIKIAHRDYICIYVRSNSPTCSVGGATASDFENSSGDVVPNQSISKILIRWGHDAPYGLLGDAS